MNRLLFVFTVLLLSPLALAQSGEKQGLGDKDLSVIEARGVNTTNGTVGPQTYDRRFLVTTDNGCAAPSSDSSNNNTEYATIPIYSPTGATLVAQVEGAGTGINDTVLFLYCNPFNAGTPEANLVAWDDDGGAGFLSAWDGSEGIVLAPNVQYFIVLTTFSEIDGGDGTYQLTVGGLNAGETVLFGSPQEARPVPTSNWMGIGLMIALLLAIGGLFTLRLRA